MYIQRSNCGSFVYVLIIVTLCLLSSCQWLPEVSGVRLSESSVTLKVGGLRQLSATVEPAAAEYEGITWTSSDPSVVSVANGQLSARKLGTATITASTEGVTSSPCTVIVEATKVTGVTINKYSLELTEGESASLIATVRPSNATDPSVSWSSNDRNVATVSGGHVSAVTAGKASITVRTNDGGYTAICEVTVKAKFIPVSGVTISSSTLSLKPGETSQLTATVAPSNATNKDVSWSSSNTSIATIASDGTVIAIAPGTVTITVTTADQGKTATCLVTVNAIPVSKITLSNTSLTLTEGDSSQLTATVTPSNATNKTVSWSSSDASVAMVADDGTVTAKSAGTATITCSSANGAVKATCQVTVKAKVYPVTGVSLDRTSLTLKEGESSQLVATISPSNATNKRVSWSSSNSSVASVASDGTVTAKSAGSATITCTTSDGFKKATCLVLISVSNDYVIYYDDYYSETNHSAFEVPSSISYKLGDHPGDFLIFYVYDKKNATRIQVRSKSLLKLLSSDESVATTEIVWVHLPVDPNGLEIVGAEGGFYDDSWYIAKALSPGVTTLSFMYGGNIIKKVILTVSSP